MLEVIMKNKTYNCTSTKDMYEGYKIAKDKESFVDTFLKESKEYGVTQKEDFFSLLLSEAIQQEDVELVKQILDMNDTGSYPSLLTNVDKIQMGPLTYALLLDEKGEIKNIIRESINHGQRFQKIILTKDAFLKMYEIVGYQGESYQECIDHLIKPIVIEEEVHVLGESVVENLDFSIFA